MPHYCCRSFLALTFDKSMSNAHKIFISNCSKFMTNGVMCSKSKYQSLGYELHSVLQQKMIVSKVQSVIKLFIHMWKEHSHEGYLDVLPMDKFKSFLENSMARRTLWLKSLISFLYLFVAFFRFCKNIRSIAFKVAWSTLGSYWLSSSRLGTLSKEDSCWSNGDSSNIS